MKKQQVEAVVREACPELKQKGCTCNLMADENGCLVGQHYKETQLQHVLRAVEKKVRQTKNADMIVVATDGTIGIDYYDRTPSFHWTQIRYNLSLPFSEQSEEVHDFLHELLVTKD